ncbi:MAG TPA: permease, partial [Naasia sp.]
MPTPVAPPEAARSALSRRRSNLSLRGVALGVGLVAALFLLRATSPSVEIDAALQDVVTLAISVIIESLPFVFLGVAISAAVQTWVPTSVILRILPRHGAPRR